MAVSPLVSVVIPTYNRAGMLQRALDSVYAQTYEPIEIIVVDDGSTDATGEILKRNATRIRAIQGQHRGASNARNLGMAAAQGTYISFLDSDDTYYPHKTEVQVYVLESFPEIALVSSEVSAVFPDGTIDEYHLKKYHDTYDKHHLTYDRLYSRRRDIRIGYLDRVMPLWSGDVFKYMLTGTLLMTNTVCFRKSILDTVGMQDPRFRYNQEYNFVTRICKKFEVGFVEVPTYKLHYHDGQATSFIHDNGQNDLEVRKKHIQRYATLLTTVTECAVEDADYYGSHAREVNPILVRLHDEIGDMYLKMGELKRAAEHYRRGYELPNGKAPILGPVVSSFRLGRAIVNGWLHGRTSRCNAMSRR
jgi:glycosyltransferase involved in cell wall biosynthesis